MEEIRIRKYMILLIIFVIIKNVKSQNLKTVTLQMPNVKPWHTDIHLCKALRVDQTKEYYVTSFEPLASKETVHHLRMMGCEEPGSKKELWNCGVLEENSTEKYFPTCRKNHQLNMETIYMWANNAGKLDMPKDVGFMIGGKSKIHYIVIQVHYVSVERFKQENVTDNSGVRITYTDVPMPKVASIYKVTSGGRILPNSAEYFEIGCKLKNELPIYPFAYRVHTHKLGKVVSAYKAVKGKEVLSEEWKLIGKKDPQLPQAFYPVENEVELNKGDYLMVRCTYVNDQNITIRTGPRTIDEMCMFYMMFWTTSKEFFNKKCSDYGPPFTDWHRHGFHIIPEDASTMPMNDHGHELHPFNSMN